MTERQRGRENRKFLKKEGEGWEREMIGGVLCLVVWTEMVDIISTAYISRLDTNFRGVLRFQLGGGEAFYI